MQSCSSTTACPGQGSRSQRSTRSWQGLQSPFVHHRAEQTPVQDIQAMMREERRSAGEHCVASISGSCVWPLALAQSAWALGRAESMLMSSMTPMLR